MAAYRTIRFTAMAAIACGLLEGCTGSGHESPTPWSYPVEPTPSPLAPFWSEGTGEGEGFRFAFATDLALDPMDADDSPDIYIYDAESGGLTFFEPEPMSEPDDFYLFDPVVSGDGRYVAWAAGMAGDMYWEADTAFQVYVRNLKTGATTQASVSSEGAPGEGHSFSVSLSADGRFVTYLSYAANLVPNDLNGGAYTNDRDVFVHDLLTRETERVDILPDGELANEVQVASMSSDGRVVVFGAWNLYARDLYSQETIAIGPEGPLNEIGLDYFLAPALSSDGSVVAFPVWRDEATDEGVEESARQSYIWIIGTDPVDGFSQVSLGPFCSASRGIDLSADGRLIAYVVEPEAVKDEETEGLTRLYVTDLSSGLTQEIALEEEWEDREGVGIEVLGLSPDGHFLVYDVFLREPIEDLRLREPLESHLYVYDLETGELERFL